MQLFPPATTSLPLPRDARPAAPPSVRVHAEPADHCAALLLDIMPRVLKAVRLAVKNRKKIDLNVPQFRALIFVQQHAGEGLSALADFLGLSLPAASKLVDGLVKRTILVREIDPLDRRRLVLRLTRKGNALLGAAQDMVRRHLAGMLSRVERQSLEVLAEALVVLQEGLMPPGGESSSPAASDVGSPSRQPAG